ncbi:glycoside hydrolase family 38 [Catenulispora acidiphila DSM 44928]|uniref:Glycoside hydrolase family 38 n=1 Tax=Catenulispora acidiphila (strain DSM 44928 / JCM 14897 / NBRC 102108 / NRRL B-24433 / ID139908) TaxID=479433 RepID=C7Q8K3_CATAD|nr:NEW3 domain-containing protein [Catenulispora acidiphila]ACU70268.1 glycoside hydrolase family 38 [Catenulispora acidiphila DSM 44928]
MAVQIKSADSMDLFVGTDREPRQVLRVVVQRAVTDGAVTVSLLAAKVRAACELAPGDGEAVVDLAMETDPGVEPGTRLAAQLRVLGADGETLAEQPVAVTVAEPGWTMYLVSHFHYDPVWWNTQAGYTQTWELQGNDGTTRPVWENNAFHLVKAHLDLAAADPDYTFVLAEVDYLKPFWDVYPQYRALLRELISTGRVEVMGGTYNEPNTNLTGLETTIRNLVYGIGYQRDIMGADPRTAWQLDVFGHDPQFPGLVADAGLSSTSWARGPYHQWGPMLTKFDGVQGDVKNMQFPAEFEWISPSGRGVITHYMPNHYSAGWWMDSSATLEEAEEKVYGLFLGLKQAAATRNTLLPVGTDYTPPNKWVTAIHRDWNARYVWPRFVTGLPRDFFAAVHAELTERGVRPSPQTRDMNPVYTGKDVSYIDTKQAQRAAETAAADAEKLATFASLLGYGRYPSAALDKVWRQLAYGAHHDAITGSESDQVYLDLVTGWREAHDLAAEARDAALEAIFRNVETYGGAGNGTIGVFNTLAFERTDLVRVTVRLPESGDIDGLRLADEGGEPVPFVVEARDGTRVDVAFVADGVPGMGWRSWYVEFEAGGSGLERDAWRAIDELPASIANEYFEVAVDPARGGGLSGIVELVSGRQLLKPGEIGNELRVSEEYPQHPEFGEGPWHLVPNGTVVGSAGAPASSVRAEESPLGRRYVVTGTVGDVEYEQRITLHHGLDRVDFRTRVLDFTGADRLLRVKFPCDIPGARPVSEVAGAVIGRGFALPDSDVAVAPWTLDNPANTFFALGSTATVRLSGLTDVADAADADAADADLGRVAISVAEVVADDLDLHADAVRELVVALARVGVTATTTTPEGARYGWLHVDSNLPDVRIVIGGPDTNALAAEIFEHCDPTIQQDFEGLLKSQGRACFFIPAAVPVEEAWVPNADLRDVRALPVLVIAGARAEDTAECVRSAAAAFAADTSLSAVTADPADTALLDDHTVGLINNGLPGFAVDPSGALHLSLMRSCTGWPSGVWLDPPLRRSPDGSAFQLQHWTHDFDYALVSGAGDWRAVGLVAAGAAFSAPMLARQEAAHRGPLPGRHALLTITPERAAQVTAVKPAGNPESVGSALDASPELGFMVRLVEANGTGKTVAVRSPLGVLSSDRADLLEECGLRCEVRAAGSVELAGSQISTAIMVPHQGSGSTATTPVLGRDSEPAQPVYSRYWLHNRGPAPMGFLPVSVAATPTVLGSGGEVSVAVASQYTDTTFEGMLTVVAPSGWSVEPESRPVSLEPGGHTVFPLTVTPSGKAASAPGMYFVRVQLAVGESVIEDVVSVLIDAPEYAPPATSPETEIELGVQTQGTKSDTARPTGLEITSITPSLTLTRGEHTTLRVTLTNTTRSRIDGEAMPVSPWGTWDFIGPYATAFSIEPGATTEVAFDVTIPATADPGHWWTLVKLMWFGRAQYTPAIPVAVR